jgi:gliding motility-associated-like protein
MRNTFKHKVLLCISNIKSNPLVMQHIYKILIIFFLTASLSPIAAQPWPNATWTSSGPCTGDEPEIQKVFVDACFDPENLNEFVYMKTGPNGWNYSNFSMQGNSAQNGAAGPPPQAPQPLVTATSFVAASATIIARLNAGLGPTCLPPNNTVFVAGNNPIPANAIVMVYPGAGPGAYTNPPPRNIPPGGINYMCGKGPIYVITGSYIPSNNAFYRNGNTGPTPPGGDVYTPNFKFGDCMKTLTYNNKAPANFPPDQGGASVGGYILGNGTVGTSACFEVAPCAGPPPPTFSNTTLNICEESIVSTTFQCTNCAAGETFSVYSNANDPNSIVYTGTSFPPPGFLIGIPPYPAIGPGTYTYYAEKAGICASTKTPLTIVVSQAPKNSPSLSAYVLTCANPTITVIPGSNTTTSQGPNFSYQWSGPNGFNSTSLTPTITQAGTYSMTVTDNTTGCKKAVLFPVITDNTAFPQVTPAPDKTIDCTTPALTTIGAASTTPNATYAWNNGPSTATQTVGVAGSYVVTITNPASGCKKLDTVVVTVNKTLPTINPISPVTVNCTTPNPSLTASASGGTGLTYAWSPSGSGSSIPITAGGSYSVIVTNPANGCTASQSIVVPEDKTLPNAVIAPPQTINCTNPSITLNPAGTSTGSNFSYNWSGAGGFSGTTFAPPNAVTITGTYTLLVTNTTNGCTKSTSVTVNEDKNLPTADAGPDVTLNCTNNQSVSIGGASSTGANFTYLWGNGNTNATQTVTTPGTYSITVTNTTNGCTKVDDVTVTLDNVAPVINSISPVTVNCFTPTPTITTNVTGSNLTYAWTPSGSGANPQITAGGNYFVTVTNSVNGCKTVGNIVVPEDKNDPTATVTATGVLNCTNNSTLTLNTTGTSTGANFTYNWTGPSGFTSSTIASPFNVTVTGTYNLTVTNTQNGCTKTTSVTVNEDKTPPAADAGTDKLLTCTNNQSVLIGGASSTGANFTYLWSNGNTNATQNVTTAGTYTITVTNTTNGCTATDAVVVTADITPPVINSISPVTVNCFTPNPQITTNVTGSNLVYSWTPSGAGANPTVTQGGTYNLTVTNSANGCTASSSVSVTEDKTDPTAVIAQPPTLTCTNGSSVVLNTTGTSTGSNFAYNWSGPGGFASSSLTPPNATMGGTYILTVTNTQNGCTKIAQTIIQQNTTLPIPANMSPQAVNCTNPQVTVGGAATGGTNFTYNWSNGAATPTVTTLVGGTFTVTVTNTDNGCTASASVTITEDKVPPTVNAGNDLSINCNTPTANANATASGGTPLTYSWSGAASGGSTLTPTFNAGGNYVLTVTNTTNGCKAVDDITVTADFVEPTAVAVVSNGINCTNTTATLNVTGSSTGANFTYAWSGPSGFTSSVANPAITTGGNYILTVTNTTNGCKKVANINVLEDKTLPTISVTNPPILTCSNPTVQLNGTGSTGANFTYNWVASNGGNITAGSSTLTPTVNSAGTYAVTVTNTTNGCTASATTNVTEDKVAPVATATGAGTITCLAPTLPLGVNVTSGSNLQFQWSATAGGNIVGNPNQQNVTANQGGTYNVTITNATNGCTTTSSVTVTANNTPPTTVVTASGTIDCTNTSIALNGTSSSNGANFNFSWSGPNGFANSTSLQPSVTVGGAYSLSITNTTNGCGSSQTIVVNENKTPPTVTVAQPSSLTCTALNVVVTANGSATNLYSWVASNGGNIVGNTSGQNINVDKAGTYTVNVISPVNGCQASASTNVAENKTLPTVTIAPPSPLTCVSPTITISGTGSSTGANFQYQWTANPGVILLGQGTLQIQTNQAGNYNLKIIDNNNNCEASASVAVTDSKSLPTAVAASSGNIDCLFPNQTLSGTGSSTGNNFSYNWVASNGGNVVQNGNTLQPTINSGGTYTLIVTNVNNSCTQVAVVNVSQNTTKPTANAGLSKVITCSSNTVQLSGSGSIGQYQIQWSNAGGNIPNNAGGNTYTPTVSQLGTYTLVVTDPLNGCSATSTTSVSLDTGVPIANAGIVKEINCNVSSVQLDGTGSTAGMTYTWTLNGNNINQNTLTPTVSQPGTYNLEVLNPANGCKGSASVQVADNRLKPTLNLVKPKVMNCANPTQTLSGTGSSLGGAFTYTWTTTNGNFTGATNALTAGIDKAGTYNFKIKNNQNGCEKDSTFTVTDNFNKPTPNVATPALLTCTQPTTTLDASASTNIANAKIKWSTTTPNGIVSGGNTFKPTIGDAGDYKLVLTDTLSQCKDSVTVKVTKDANIPQASIDIAPQLNCTIKDITLNASASQGANIVFAWTTSNGGNIVSGGNTLKPVINTAGKYTLKVTNNTNQCVKEASVDITQDTLKPTIVIAKPGILDCKTTILALNAIGSSSGVGFTTAWAIPSSAFVGGGALTPQVKAPGTFTLTITNNATTCKSVKTVTVTQDIVKPTASIGKADTLNCINLTSKLNGAASANSGFYTYSWTDTPNGIIKDKTTLSPTVNKEGNYQLIVTDTVNACATTAQITVIKNVQTPIVDAGNGGNITCTVKDVQLSGNASNGNPNDFIYTWSTVGGGNIVGATNNLTAKADAPGKYYFEVVNKTNGCTAKDSTTVTVDANVPTVQILTNGDLDCKTQTLVLDGSGSSQGAGISFKWTTVDGNFVKDQNTLKPTVNSQGTYKLEIINANNNCVKSIEKEIKNDTIKPIINVSQEIITCAKPTIELGAKVFQAKQYSVLWTTAAGNILTAKKDTLNIQVDKKGIYKITAKNAENECENTKDVNVLEDKVKPTVDVGPALEINCKDSVITLQADKSSKGVDFVYNWTTTTGNILNGEKTLNPQIDKGGIYTLSIFNKGNGCSEKNNIDIKINKTLPNIVIAKPDTLTCKKQQVSVVANTTVTGTPQYTWSGNIVGEKINATIISKQPGVYNVTVVDSKNFCVSKNTIQVYQDTIKPTVSAGANIELDCLSPTIDVTGTATAKNTLTYQWTTTNGEIVANGDKTKVTVKGAGFYNLNVTNNFNGCSATDVMEVTFLGAPKAVIITPEKLNCTRTTVLLDSKGSDAGNNFTYKWTDNSGTTIGTNATANVTVPGTYNFTLLNTNNNCSKNLQVTVTQDTVKPIANAGANDVIDCDKGFVKLNGGKSSQGTKYAYKWTGGIIENGENTETPSVSAQAVYTLIVTNTDNGCTAKDTVGVTSLKPALLEVVAQDPLCTGQKGSITFKTITGGTPPFSYSIDGGKNFFTTTFYNNLKPNDYVVAVKDSKGCVDEDNAIIVEPEKLTITLPTITTIKIGDDIQLQATVNPTVPKLKSVNWSPDSLLSCRDCLDPTIKAPLKNLYLTLTVVSENGCEATARTVVDIDKRIDIYVPSVFTPNGDNINDRFFVMGKPELVIGVKWLRVFDRWGEMVYEALDLKPNDDTLGWDGSFKGVDVNPAVFIWNCEVVLRDGTVKTLKGDVTLKR